jgi:hypothetical protein
MHTALDICGRLSWRDRCLVGFIEGFARGLHFVALRDPGWPDIRLSLEIAGQDFLAIALAPPAGKLWHVFATRPMAGGTAADHTAGRIVAMLLAMPHRAEVRLSEGWARLVATDPRPWTPQAVAGAADGG